MGIGSWIADFLKWAFMRDGSPREDFETLYKEWQNIVSELKNRNAGLETRVEALEKEIDSMKNAEIEYRRKSWDADHLIEVQRSQIQILQGRVAELESHVQRLETELSSYRSNNPPATA